MIFPGWLVCVSTLVACLLIYIKWKFMYWCNKGVPYIKPQIPFGTSENLFARKNNVGIWLQQYYRHFKSLGYKYGGLYTLLQPALLLVDLKLIKNVMSKDFQYFSDRGFYCNEKSDPLSANLFKLEGDRWRALRAKLTPTFTSGKIKIMFSTLVECSYPMYTSAAEHCLKKIPIELKHLSSCFTTDVIGSCAFGIECNSFTIPDSDFLKYSKGMLTTFSKLGALKMFLAFSYHSFAKRLNISLTHPKVERFFMNLVKETVTYRIQNNIIRNDFLQLLMNVKNEDGTGMTIEDITAQVYIFFFAGFDTSSTTMAFCLYELAINEVMQEKLRCDINTTLAKYGNIVTYDAIKEIAYLSNVIDETLRKYPPGALIPRVCVKNYQIPETDVVVTKGTRVFIPVYAVHHDPEYFPDPEQFDPERFNDDNKFKIAPFSYMPFGEGPRICIASRFGLLQTKVGLITLIRHFRFTLNQKTQLPIRFSPNNIIITPEGGIWLDIQKVPEMSTNAHKEDCE